MTASTELPDGLSAGDIYARLTTIVRDREGTDPDRLRGDAETANVLDSVTELEDLDDAERRDAVGAFTLQYFSGPHAEGLTEVLYATAARIRSGDVALPNNSGEHRRYVAWGVRSIAYRMESMLMPLKRDGDESNTSE